MVVTSVTGHLMELDFKPPFNKWHSCAPVELFSAPVERRVPADKEPLKAQLEAQARRARVLVLWLDCDAEGENIASEV